MIEEFKNNVVDSPAIRFEQVTQPYEAYRTFNPGQQINVINVGSFSIGFRAQLISDPSVKGFVTSAHKDGNSALPVGTTVLQGSTIIGNVLKSKFSGNTDAAFVQLKEGHDMSNSILNSNDTLTSTAVSVVPAKTVIYKSGDATGLTSGTVLSVNTLVPQTRLRVTVSTNHAAKGDSGGLVYVKSGSTTGIVGIVHGGENGNMYTCTYHNIASELGIKPY